MSRVTFREDYFSTTFKWIGAIACFAIGVLSVKYALAWMVAPMLILIVIFFTTYNEIIIDVAKGIATDSSIILGVTTRKETQHFTSMKRIRVDKNKHGYTANSRARTAQTDFFEYVGTLELDSGELELTRALSYSDFSDRIQMLSADLNISAERTF